MWSRPARPTAYFSDKVPELVQSDRAMADAHPMTLRSGDA